jgi:hypothetical protein
MKIFSSIVSGLVVVVCLIFHELTVLYIPSKNITFSQTALTYLLTHSLTHSLHGSEYYLKN